MADDHLRGRGFTDVFQSASQMSPKAFKMDLSPTSLALWMRKDLGEVDVSRLQRYYDNWNMFFGHHFTNTDGTCTTSDGDGIKRVVHNYIKAFANKLNRFLNINGFSVILPKDYEKLQVQLNKIWEVNQVKLLALKLGLNGVISGDMWIRVNFKNDGDKKAISFSTIDSSLVFPRFDFQLKMVEVEIRHPLPNTDGTLNPSTFIAEVHSLNEEEVKFYQSSYSKGREAEIPELNYVNPLKDTLLVVHGANYEVANSFWGIDDLTDLNPLNKEINEVASSMREVIDYQEQPVTVIKGAKVRNIQKSGRKVWSGIPKDGSVELLALNTDLPATQAYMANTLQTMHDIGGVPQQSLGRHQNISNTSGIALHYQNMPLMEVRSEKMKTYGKFYKETTVIVIKLLKWMSIIAQPVDDSFLEEEFLVPVDGKNNPVQEMAIDFPTPLPRDQVLLLNEIDAMVNLGLLSEPKAYRMLGWKPEEVEKVREEILANPIIRPAPPVNPNINLAGMNQDGDEQKKKGQPPKDGVKVDA